MTQILKKRDAIDGAVYACPHCHRYVTRESGIQRCHSCGGEVDNDHVMQYDGRVVCDGAVSWW